MSDRGWIEPIVERVASKVLDSHAGQMRAELVQQVMQEIAAQPAPESVPSGSSAVELARAVTAIQAGTSQKEILRALLDASACCAERVALFVVKGSHATGWQARGFDSNDAVKDFALDSNARAVVQAIVERSPADAGGAEFDVRFAQTFGAPSKGEARLLPLILKDKVAALVYADGGTRDGQMDTGAIEVLVLATSSWLEVNALRKQAQKEPSTAADGPSAPVAAPAAQAFNDPFAAHAPAYAMAAAATSESGSSSGSAHGIAPVETEVHPEAAAAMRSAAAEVQSAGGDRAALAAGPISVGHVSPPAGHDAPSPASTLSPEDQELHRKAQRFARLLVDEIKLYNQAKVSEGRKNHDLYDRLKDTIEKSRATYQKRYGNTVAASSNYFQHELIRSLAEDDVTIMGPNFRL